MADLKQLLLMLAGAALLVFALSIAEPVCQQPPPEDQEDAFCEQFDAKGELIEQEEVH